MTANHDKTPWNPSRVLNQPTDSTALDKLIAEAREDEREACAETAETCWIPVITTSEQVRLARQEIANDIRARSAA